MPRRPRSSARPARMRGMPNAFERMSGRFEPSCVPGLRSGAKVLAPRLPAGCGEFGRRMLRACHTARRACLSSLGSSTIRILLSGSESVGESDTRFVWRESPKRTDGYLAAMADILSHNSGKAIPAVEAASGRRLFGVIPGRTFASRQKGEPSSETRKSTLE